MARKSWQLPLLPDVAESSTYDLRGAAPAVSSSLHKSGLGPHTLDAEWFDNQTGGHRTISQPPGRRDPLPPPDTFSRCRILPTGEPLHADWPDMPYPLRWRRTKSRWRI